MGGNAPNMIEAYPKLKEKIQDVLKKLEIANTLEISKFEQQKIFEFKLKTGITNNALNFADLSCGTSQILPLLVQILFHSLYLQDKSMIIIEQPEVHLHPKVQADFASFLVESVKSKTKFLIETHSEHFIERIRPHILKNPRLAEDVVIYYVEQNKDKKHSEVTKIEINSEGQYSTLPEGYLINFRAKEIAVQMDLMFDSLKEKIGIREKEKQKVIEEPGPESVMPKVEVHEPESVVPKVEVHEPESVVPKVEAHEPERVVKVEAPKQDVKKKEKNYTYMWIGLIMLIIFILLLYLIMTR